jgi:RNA polymerase sigma factor (sigma-70 family)
MKHQSVSGAVEDLAQITDPELVAQCLDGSQAAWVALITRYQRLIYSIPLRARLSADDAADIFQSVCLKLYEKLSTLRDHDRISSWLITTTNRECWRVSARNRRDSPPSGFEGEDEGERIDEIPSAAMPIDEQREALERQQIVRETVESLPERCRDLLRMLFYQKDELSYADVAQRMRIPVPSVGPTRARCLEKLKKLLNGKI